MKREEESNIITGCTVMSLGQRYFITNSIETCHYAKKL